MVLWISKLHKTEPKTKNKLKQQDVQESVAQMKKISLECPRFHGLASVRMHAHTHAHTHARACSLMEGDSFGHTCVISGIAGTLLITYSLSFN